MCTTPPRPGCQARWLPTSSPTVARFPGRSLCQSNEWPKSPSSRAPYPPLPARYRRHSPPALSLSCAPSEVAVLCSYFVVLFLLCAPSHQCLRGDHLQLPPSIFCRDKHAASIALAHHAPLSPPPNHPSARNPVIRRESLLGVKHYGAVQSEIVQGQ